MLSIPKTSKEKEYIYIYIYFVGESSISNVVMSRENQKFLLMNLLVQIWSVTV
jgi:hypothetical protein